MLGRNRRRLGVAVIAASLTLAAPAYAHFCSKSGWSDAALEHAAKSGAWLTAEEWIGFIEEFGSELPCPEAATNLIAQVESRPDNTLFMGPGLLAGGAEFRSQNGKGAPEKFNYLDFDAAVGECFA